MHEEVTVCRKQDFRGLEGGSRKVFGGTLNLRDGITAELSDFLEPMSNSGLYSDTDSSGVLWSEL